ncbi:MAG: hypothetical protein MJZ11_07655 [Lachnospiraceae bacterium]|nr:hypothetical protein [Lachnospiraceae bacterium]
MKECRELHIHISIDDVKGVFRALTKEKMNSIFDTRMLGFLKTMHEKYNAQFDLYCTYSIEGYLFTDISDRYQKEFINNSNWIRLGFHCYSEQEDRSSGLFIGDIDLFMGGLIRIAGQSKMPQYLRTHKFLGDVNYCKALTEKGVSFLLTADDNRNCYYHDGTITDILAKNGYWHDDKNDISFVKTAFRLEKVDDVYKEIMHYRKKEYPVVAIFTHECFMDSIDIRDKFETCCKLAMEDH